MDDGAGGKRNADLPEAPAAEVAPSHVQLDRFCSAVLDDATVRADLASIEDQDIFVARVVELGATRGFIFTADDIQDAMQETRRRYNGRFLVS
jgi:hypothetical protein